MLSVSRRNFLSLTASGWGKLIFEDDFNNGAIDGASGPAPLFVMFGIDARHVCFAAGIFRGGHFSWGADAGGLVSGERGFDVRGV